MNETTTAKRSPVVRTGIIVLTVAVAAFVAELAQRMLLGQSYIGLTFAVVLVAGALAMQRTR